MSTFSGPVVETAGLRKEYAVRRGTRVAVAGLDLAVEAGGVHGFLGPNGSGKTTTIRMLLGLARPTAGTMRLFGEPVPEHLPRVVGRVGAVVESPKFSPHLSGRRNLLLLSRSIGAPDRRVDAAVETVGLTGRDRDRYRTYSLGMKQRLAIAATLLKDPALLILDEPTAGVDIELRRSMWEYMRRINRDEGTTIILTTHYLEEAESLCRNIAIINHGEIVRNTSVRELLAELDTETFLLDLAEPVAQVPTIEGFELQQIEPSQLALVIHRGQQLNDVFSALSAQGIQVVSMRNRANRLEEMFVSMVESSQQAIDQREKQEARA